MPAYLIIHRGTNEIGGSCLEIDGILFDFGIPLETMDLKDYSIEDYKLNIKGLYKNEKTPLIKAIFLTHAHPDHYGLLELVNPEIPIYVTQTTYDILTNISHLTSKFKTSGLNLHVVSAPIKIGDIKISAHEIDHSIAGACAFKIKTNNKTVVYTGDIRFHGRCEYKNANFINAIKNPDYLIMEGTTLGRSEQEIIKEDDLVEKFVDVFNEDKLPLVLFSPQNLDRFITIYKACLKAKKTLVIDPYTCYLLELYGKHLKNIPQFDSNNISVYFARNSISDKLAEDNKLWKYKAKKISFDEIVQEPLKYVIKGNFAMNEKILEQFNKNELNIIFSMWKGYLDKPSQIDQYKDTITHIHTSGHAYIKDLQEFTKLVNPTHIIPIHTENKEKYAELFNPDIIELKDGQKITL